MPAILPKGLTLVPLKLLSKLPKPYGEPSLIVGPVLSTKRMPIALCTKRSNPYDPMPVLSRFRLFYPPRSADTVYIQPVTQTPKFSSSPPSPVHLPFRRIPPIHPKLREDPQIQHKRSCAAQQPAQIDQNPPPILRLPFSLRAHASHPSSCCVCYYASHRRYYALRVDTSYISSSNTISS